MCMCAYAFAHDAFRIYTAGHKTGALAQARIDSEATAATRPDWEVKHVVV